MHALKECTECKRQLSLDLFYKKGNRIESRCSDCVKAAKGKVRRFKRLSKAGNAKRICSLHKVKRSTIAEGNTEKVIQMSLIDLFRNNNFDLGAQR